MDPVSRIGVDFSYDSYFWYHINGKNYFVYNSAPGEFVNGIMVSMVDSQGHVVHEKLRGGILVVCPSLACVLPDSKMFLCFSLGNIFNCGVLGLKE